MRTDFILCARLNLCPEKNHTALHDQTHGVTRNKVYIGGQDKSMRREPAQKGQKKNIQFSEALVSYLNDLVDGFLVDGQAGKGVFTEALGEGTKRQQTLRIDLQQKATML